MSFHNLLCRQIAVEHNHDCLNGPSYPSKANEQVLCMLRLDQGLNMQHGVQGTQVCWTTC